MLRYTMVSLGRAVYRQNNQRQYISILLMVKTVHAENCKTAYCFVQTGKKLRNVKLLIALSKWETLRTVKLLIAFKPETLRTVKLLIALSKWETLRTVKLIAFKPETLRTVKLLIVLSKPETLRTVKLLIAWCKPVMAIYTTIIYDCRGTLNIPLNAKQTNTNP